MSRSSRRVPMDLGLRGEKLPFLGDDTRLEHDDASLNERQQQGQISGQRRGIAFWPFVLLLQLVISGAVITVLMRRLASLQSSTIAAASVAAYEQYSNHNGLAMLRPTINYTVWTPEKDWWDRPLYTDLSLESGMAWHYLLEKQAFRISPEEMARYGIPDSLWDGEQIGSGGFPGVLSVFHDLHCIRHIKQELFNEYYFPGRTVKRAAERVPHTKHCLEVLRQSVMCNADLTPLALRWSRAENTSFVKPESLRRCADWDSLLYSVKDRQYLYEEIIPKDL